MKKLRLVAEFISVLGMGFFLGAALIKLNWLTPLGLGWIGTGSYLIGGFLAVYLRRRER